MVCATGLSAQITLTTDYFPVPGDTLRSVRADSTSTAAAATQLQAEGGADLAWNFSGLVAARNINEPVRANTDTLFPNAGMVIQSDQTLSFYQSTATSFDLVGIRTDFDFLPNFPLSTAVSPARPVRRAPLNFGDSFTSVTENTVTISPDSIPEEAREEIGDVLDGVDSVRITTISTREDVVDAWGTVRLFDNFYPVLRERRTEGVFIRIELRTLPLNWIDVTGTITLINPDLAALVGQQPETVTYLFWNDESKEPIIEVITDEESGQPSTLRYKRALQSTSTQGPGALQARVRVFPNPTRNFATFEIEGLAPGNYQLQLVNMTGKRVAIREFSPFGNQTRLNLDASELPAGLYLYSIQDGRGRRVVTKKLQVL